MISWGDYFEGKHVVVSGTASGIGLAVANYLIVAGAHVLGLDKVEHTLKGGNVCVLDLSDDHAIEERVIPLIKLMKGVDGLVNVAGVLRVGPRAALHEMELEHWQGMFEQNVGSLFKLTRRLIPYMLAQENAAIVNISSDQSFRPQKNAGAYGVTKACVNALSIQLALDLMDYEIRVNALALGSVESNFLSPLIPDEEQREELYQKSEKELPFGVMKPEEAARMVLFLLSDNSARMTGEVIRADSGQSLASITF